ncbi:MAG: hypothetical protein BIFFINMI_03251 [Phycisphaerae bacterium]|nr:hypothetical protein [Phycisphaerae bacterium]
MHWVRVGPAGDRPTGYSDGQDVGGAAARADYRLSWGNRLQEGKPCTLSRPASAAFPDNGGRLLTDGYVGIASFWNLQDIRLAGKKNEKRVGELAVWSPGEPVVATIDLGEARTAGGARVCAVGPNHDILFPQTMEVEVSADGKTFTPAGSAGWEDCFFPPIDEMRWEGEDSPVYDDLPAGGIIDNRFPILFDRPRAARYVRFTLTPQPGKGIGLWELEVYDRVTRTEGGERIQLPTPEGK